MSVSTNLARRLRARFTGVALLMAAVVWLIGEALGTAAGTTDALALRAVIAFLLIAAVALPGLGAGHPFRDLGYANWITTFRASLVALVAALLVEPRASTAAWITIIAASIAAALDGWDGWLARRTRMEGAFGARFDMEVDALLILLLSLVVWRYEKAGGWVVLSGLLRYVFVAAGWIAPWLTNPLFPSTRRKTVCVVQIVALIVAIGPIVPPPLSAAIAAVSLALLVWSFGVDVLWLWRTGPA